MVTAATEPDLTSRTASADTPTLAPNEERYVLAEALTPATYITPWAHLIEGPLDAGRLLWALAKMAERHDVLRTRYHKSGPASWTREILASAPPELKRLDRPGQTLAALRAELEPWLFAPVDFTPQTLCRFALVRIAPEQHWFVFSLHHALSDGTSFTLFLDELFRHYDGEGPESPAPPYRSLFAANWRDEPRYQADLDWWKQRLAGIEPPDSLPADLEGDDPRAVAAECELPVLPAEATAVTDAATVLRVSPFTIWLAASALVVARLQDDPQVVAAFQTSGRRSVPGSDGAQGCFSNALVLSLTIEPAETVADLIHRVRGDMRAVLQHESVPFHDILQATGVHPTIGINWFPPMPAVMSRTLTIHPAENMGRSSDYQVNLRFIQSRHGLRLILYYRPGVLSQQMAEAITHRIIATGPLFARCLDAQVQDIASTDPVPQPPALPAIAVPAEPIHARFLAVAADHPHRPALRYLGRRLSYAELEAKSARLALRLRDLGAAQGRTVAVLASRGPAAVEAMLGVSRSGGAFAMIDTAYPETRWRTMIDIVRPVAILWVGEAGAEAAATALAAELGLPFLDCHTAGPAPSGASLPDIDADSTAYLLFTSGTTGAPRCIATAHRPLVHFLAWQRGQFGLRADDRFTMVSGLSHDPLMRDVFAPLSLGAELLIPEQEILTAPRGLLGWCQSEAPTVMHLTPPLGRLLTDHADAGDLPALRLMFWGGDLLRPSLIADVARVAPNARSVNFYGATETPQAIAWNDAAPAVDGSPRMRAIPIGEATPGFDLSIEQADGSAAAAGEVGEIVVRSDLLSRGYVRDGELHPHDPAGTYRTGDRAFRLPSGKIMLSGRRDDQIKVRGYRVELADVAAGLENDPRVRQAAAIVLGTSDEARIEAFAVLNDPGSATGPDLQQAVAATRPAYLVPSRIHIVDRLPLLANGKLDRQALHALTLAADTVPAKGDGPTAEEAALMAAWADVLGRPIQSPHRSFAELGGDSLSFVQAFMVLEEQIGNAPEGWQFRPIAELVGNIGSSAPSWGRSIDTATLVRAVVIVAIVGFHFGLFGFGGGATSALFIVSGFLLGGLQLTAAFAARSAVPVFRLFTRVAIPATVISLMLWVLKFLDGDNPSLAQHVFAAPFIDYQGLGPLGESPYSLMLWYVQSALYILLIIGALLTIVMRFFPSWRSWHFCLWLFFFSLPFRFLLPALLAPDWFNAGAPVFHVVSYLPTTHLATFALGMLMATSSKAQHPFVAALILGYSLISMRFFDSSAYLFLIAAGFLLLLKPYVRVPKAFSNPLALISASSLFIYLMHLLVIPFRRKFDLPSAPWLEVAAGLALGLVTWRIWTEILRFFYRRGRLEKDRFSDSARSQL